MIQRGRARSKLKWGIIEGPMTDHGRVQVIIVSCGLLLVYIKTITTDFQYAAGDVCSLDGDESDNILKRKPNAVPIIDELVRIAERRVERTV